MGVRILTPSDTVTIQNSGSGSYNVSVADIIAFRPDSNSFVLGRSSNKNGYYVRYFNISSDLIDLYLGDNTYLGTNRGGFNLDGKSFTNPTQLAYYYTGSTFASLGYNSPFMGTFKDGRSYSYCSEGYNNSWDFCIYVGVNVSGTTYVNGEPLVPPIVYTWQSVSSISGKNGILSLAQIKEEYINDGESVSGAAADHFTNLSTGNRVDVLIDVALPSPEIGGTTVTVKYTIPSLSIGSYEYCKLVAKKNSIPEGPEDGDKIVEIDPSSTSIVIRGLDGLSTYYFVIFIEDDQGNAASSDPRDCTTGVDEGWNYDYTGEIQTFVAPKTGIYQLETWGAQGGDATDGTLTARGGYGAYAYGEVLLTQGEKLYINVGGQNGYGGGGGYVLKLDDYLKNLDYSNYIYISGGQNKVTPFSGYEPNIQQYYGTNKILVVGKSENLRPVWDSENNCIKTNGTAGRYDYVFVAIPLPHRIYGVTKYTAIGKRENNGNTYGSIGVGCIVNDSMRQTKGGNSFETDWANIELDGDSGTTSDAGFTYYHLEDMPYIDYLIFELSQGNLFWKDNKLYFD